MVNKEIIKKIAESGLKEQANKLIKLNKKILLALYLNGLILCLSTIITIIK